MTHEQILNPNRAGMVCFNVVGHVLVVSALGKNNEWVLPKGHIEDNESSYEAAEREVREEADVFARVRSTTEPLGVTEFWMPMGQSIEERVVTEWWAGIAHHKVVPTSEEYNESDWRIQKWLPWKAALEALSYPDQRRILRRALCLPENFDSNLVTVMPEPEVNALLNKFV